MGTLRLVGSDPLSPPELREEKAIPCEKLAFMLLSNDARYIAGLGVEGYKLWERDSARLLCSFPDTTSRAQAWAFTGWAFPPDGSVLAVSDVRGTVGFYRPRAGSLAKRLSGSEAGLFALTFSADGRLFGATTLDRRVRVWDLANDRLLISSAGPQVGLMRDVAFSPAYFGRSWAAISECSWAVISV